MSQTQRLEIYHTETAIAERKRHAAAERARRYRAAKREEGRPDVNAVDAAIGEAVSMLGSVANPEVRGAGEEAKVTVVIDIAELHAMAVINLVRNGARRSFARHAVSNRMNKRPVHDQPYIMPSRRLSEYTAMLERPLAGEWKPEEIGFVRRVVKRWRDGIARSNS